MAETNPDAIESQFRQALEDCRELYLSAGHHCIQNSPALIPGAPRDFLQLLDDLHKGLLIKIFSSVAQVDMRWTAEESHLAAILLEHLWQQRLAGQQLRDAAEHLVTQGHRLTWYSLVRPFDQIAPLRGRVAELETIIVRVGNLVAKCDGVVTDSEATLLQTIQEEIAFQLHPIPLDDPGDRDQADRAATQAVQQMQAERPRVPAGSAAQERRSIATTDSRPPAERLQEALRELHELIGIESVKQEVT